MSPGVPIVLVAISPEHADKLHEDLLALGDLRTRCYPQREALPYGDEDPHIEISAQRVDALAALLANRCRVLVTTARALIERSPIPVHSGESLSLDLSIGDGAPLEDLADRLERMGFIRTHSVREIGDFTVRGGLIDAFPFGHPAPLRIELWGDEIVSLRRFDALTQRSTETCDNAQILPIDLMAGEDKGNTERRSLVELLPSNAIMVHLEPENGIKARSRLWNEIREARKRASDQEVTTDVLAVPPSDAELRLKQFRRIEFITDNTENMPGAIQLPVEPPPKIDRDMKRLIAQISRTYEEGGQTLILCDNEGQIERLEEIVVERAGRDMIQHVTLAVGSLSGGFRVDPPSNLTVLTDHEVFRRAYRRHRVRFKGAATLESIASIQPGDYVVHIDHGIGRYHGIQRVKVDGQTIETLEIEYADGELLRLPHYRLDLIERWGSIPSNARPPRVHKLGGKKWSRLKRRTVSAIEETAVDLLQLYARRKLAEGRAFASDNLWQTEMESAFIYEETPHQIEAWKAVCEDLEKPNPMDRLICGDVGFGKTEIAIRAAFKVALEGAQVAILAPTTILVEQHLRTFQERLAAFPLRIESLSRFRTSSEQKEVIGKLASGHIDLVIGTHRLLSQDITFKDLGLLIVDEEQRFGVKQKEHLKELREAVDVLTLTATPIPRTLHLALGGIRDLSLMRTPPRNRMPIITHVLDWDASILEEALRRELDRGGQIFFVHDRVETIDALARRVQHLLPEARTVIAHGQMPERALEDAMYNFIEGDIDILICTSIIENGLDVPSANTMIVHRAHNFGLAQLYQLRGRIGRSHRRAYCYLLVPENVAPEATERLRVLEHHTELGSGYDIALKDLEFRGTGNLLGSDQSGFATAVGIETYQRLVESTVQRLKGDGTMETKPGIQISVDGESFLPDDYVSEPQQKVNLYRRLSRLDNWEKIEDMRDELRDRFGPLPKPTARLLDSAKLRVLGTTVGAAWIRVSDTNARITFQESATPQLGLLKNALVEHQLDVEVRRLQPLSLVLRRAGPEPLLPTLVEALGLLSGATGERG